MNKKTILMSTALLAAGLTAQAESYTYLNIEKTDGTAASITAVGTTISFANGMLTAKNGTETLTFALSEVSNMFFSNELNATGISATLTGLPADSQGQSQADGIYNLQGQRIGDLSSRNTLRRGIYIIRQNGNSTKTFVK